MPSIGRLHHLFLAPTAAVLSSSSQAAAVAFDPMSILSIPLSFMRLSLLQCPSRCLSVSMPHLLGPGWRTQNRRWAVRSPLCHVFHHDRQESPAPSPISQLEYSNTITICSLPDKVTTAVEEVPPLQMPRTQPHRCYLMNPRL